MKNINLDSDGHRVDDAERVPVILKSDFQHSRAAKPLHRDSVRMLSAFLGFVQRIASLDRTLRGIAKIILLPPRIPDRARISLLITIEPVNVSPTISLHSNQRLRNMPLLAFFVNLFLNSSSTKPIPGAAKTVPPRSAGVTGKEKGRLPLGLRLPCWSQWANLYPFPGIHTFGTGLTAQAGLAVRTPFCQAIWLRCKP